MPILLILFLSLFSTLFVSDPLYSLQQSTRYPNRKMTQNLKVPYFVKDTFHQDFQGSLRRYETLPTSRSRTIFQRYTIAGHCRLEASIEEDFLHTLRQNCFREKANKENLLWQAR